MQKKYFAAALFLLTTSPSSAATILDATGDFLPGFVGPNSSDLDITGFSVDYNSSTQTFILGAVFAGAIDAATPGFYAIGVNTGAGAIAPFTSLGQPNVKFDQVIAIQKDGTGSIFGGDPLPAGAVTKVGNLFIASVPASLLVSTGEIPEHYGFNIWPRLPGDGLNLIADFAPENAVVAAISAPEPATWAMMVLGVGAVAAMMRRQRIRAKFYRSLQPT